MSRRFHIDIRLAAAGVLAAVAALTVLLLTQPEARYAIATSQEALAAGSRLTDAELGTRSVVDIDGFVPEERIDEFADHTLTIDLPAGVPIVEAALAAPDSGNEPDLVGLQLEAAAAVHGRLSPGDRVDVYSSDTAELVGAGLTVVDVEIDQGALGSGRVGVILAIDETVAPSLIAAGSSLFLVRLGS